MVSFSNTQGFLFLHLFCHSDHKSQHISVAFLWLVFLFVSPLAYGQSDTLRQEKTEVLALKNNLLYDAMATPNLQVEFRLNDQWSMEIGAGFNPFPLDDTKFPKWRHVEAHIAPRYWFCHTFNRDFISFNVAYAHYNVAGGKYPLGWIYKPVLSHRYQGDAVMAGLSYGWHFAISPHFSIELEIGADAGYTWFDEFECKHCGDKTNHAAHWFALPKAGVNISIPLGGDEESLNRRCDCEKYAEQDTIIPEPIDTIVPEPVDTIVPEPVDTIVPEPVDTIVPEPIDTIIPEPVDTVPAVVVPVVVVPEIDMNSEEIIRLRSALLRDESEYVPYDINSAMSADPRNVFVFFDVDVAKMDRQFLQNSAKIDSIVHILGQAVEDTTIRITHIQIVGYASFDGRLAYNERLAQTRANTIKEYMQSLYDLDDSLFVVCNGGESWAELRYMLQDIEFEGKDEVLSIIDTEPNLDKREALIRQLNNGNTYRYMRDRLKHIMRNLGCITIYFEEVK